MTALSMMLYWLGSFFLGLFVLTLFWEMASRVSAKKSVLAEKNLDEENRDWDPIKAQVKLREKTDTLEIAPPKSPVRPAVPTASSLLHPSLFSKQASSDSAQPKSNALDPWEILRQESTGTQKSRKARREIPFPLDKPSEGDQS